MPEETMDIFFQDPSEIPLPPGEVHIRELRVQPWPDGRRVKVYLEVDPFQKRPSALVTITDASSEEVASISIIESMVQKMEFTMHLRKTTPGPHTIQATLYYANPADASGQSGETPPEGPEIHVVDQATTEFEVRA